MSQRKHILAWSSVFQSVHGSLLGGIELTELFVRVCAGLCGAASKDKFNARLRVWYCYKRVASSSCEKESSGLSQLWVFVGSYRDDLALSFIQYSWSACRSIAWGCRKIPCRGFDSGSWSPIRVRLFDEG